MNTHLAKETLAADDAVVFLDRARREAWRSPDARRRAARLLTDHLWPDDGGAQPPNWAGEYVRDVREKRARERMGTHRPPSGDGGWLDGYHAGGVWFPEPAIASA